MVSRIGDEIWLPDANVTSLADARAEIAAAIGGKARILTELATGLATENPPATGRNPQNKIGCDLSGPPWGSALRMPIATRSGRIPDTTAVIDHDGPGTATFIAAGIVTMVSIGPWGVWNRPFEKLPAGYFAPHSRGYFTLRAHGSTTEIIDVFVRAWNQTMGQDPAGGRSVSTSFSLTVAEASYDPGLYVDLLPGRNVIRFQLLATEATNQLTVDSITLEQRAKRTH